MISRPAPRKNTETSKPARSSSTGVRPLQSKLALKSGALKKNNLQKPNIVSTKEKDEEEEKSSQQILGRSRTLTCWSNSFLAEELDEKIENKKSNKCKFCNIVQNKKEKILFEDDLCAIFHDIKKKSAKQHILLVPKQHIKDVNAMGKSNIPLLNYLQKTAEDYMKSKYPKEKYR